MYKQLQELNFGKSLSRRQILNSQKYMINSKFVKVEKIERTKSNITIR